MDVISDKVLVAIRDFLTRIIASNELSRDFHAEANLAAMALDYELSRQRSRGDYLDRAQHKEQALISELEKSAASDVQDIPIKRRWNDIWTGYVGADLSQVLSTILNAPGIDDATFQKATQELRSFLIDYYKYFDPSIEAGAAATYEDQGGRQAKVSNVGQLDQDSLEKYLRQRFADDTTHVTLFKKLTGGYSKETYLVDLTSGKAGEQKIVLRKDGIGLPTGGTVVDEFSIIDMVRDYGVPAPKPLWIEPDTNIFGTAVMAVDFVKGQLASSIIPSEQKAKRQWAKDFAECLANIHQIRPADPSFDLVQSLLRDLDRMEARIIDRERIPHPGLVAGLAWLRKNIICLKRRPASLVHGDVGFHNIMMHNNKIATLLDWEFNHYSDPAEDLIYCKLFIDQLMPWAEFIEVYKSHGGQDYPEEVAQFFEVWKEVRNSEACIGSLNSLLIPEVKDIKLAVAGCLFAPKFEIAALDAILAK